MTVTELLTLAGQFGPMGLMVAYLVWREKCDQQLKKDEVSSREKLASALTTLSIAITGKPYV